MKRRPRFSSSPAIANTRGDFKGLLGSLGSFAVPARCYVGMLKGLLLACIVAFPSLAQAARILLVQPSGSDATTLETFNRLRGELHVHGFQVVLAQGANEARSGAADLASMTELHGALAGVRLVRGSKPVSAEIWIAGRGTGSTGNRAFLTSTDKDAPPLLAIRVVDLLRTNLREHAGDQAPTSGIPNPQARQVSPEVAPSASSVEKTDHPSRPAGLVTGERAGNPPASPSAQGSHQPPMAAKPPPPSPPGEEAPRPAPSPEPAPDQPADPGAPTPGTQDAHPAPAAPDGAVSASPIDGASRFSLSGGLVTSFDDHLRLGLGPSVSAHYMASRWLGISLGFIGPVFGQTYKVLTVTARVREEMLFLLATLSAWRYGRVAQNVFIGPGGAHIAVRGEAQQPLVGRNSSAWMGAALAGTGISYQVLPRLRIELSVGALLLVPRPVIETAEGRQAMSDPQFLSRLAIQVGL